MQLEQLYQEIILDHYRSPHHHGLREPFDAQVHHVNPTCGDEITLRVALGEPGGPGSGRPVVRDVSYDSLGCSISQASTSVLTDTVIGLPVAEALARVAAFDAMVTSRGNDPGDEELLGDGVAFAGVAKYPNRVKCALMSWLAFRQAVDEALGSDRAGGDLVGGDRVRGDLVGGNGAGGDLTASDLAGSDRFVGDGSRVAAGMAGTTDDADRSGR